MRHREVTILCEELIHWKRPWCWERFRAEEEGDNRGWDGWMASPTQWTWVRVNSGSWWWTGRPWMLQSMGSRSQTWLSDWTELNTNGERVHEPKHTSLESVQTRTQRQRWVNKIQVEQSILDVLCNSKCLNIQVIQVPGREEREWGCRNIGGTMASKLEGQWLTDPRRSLSPKQNNCYKSHT